MRFPEFKGEWKKDIASDLLECFSTNSITWEDLNFDGGTMKDLHYGLIHKGFNKSIMPADSKLIPWINSGKEPKKYTKIKDGDLILADASEDTNECGEPVELLGCLNSDVVSGLHTIHCRDKKKFSVPGFKAYLFQSEGIKKQLYRLCEGTKIYSISPSTLNEVVLNFPSNEEQQKVVKLLNFIEQRIVVQRKIIKEKEQLKKWVNNACLWNKDFPKVALNKIIKERNLRTTTVHQYQVLSSAVTGLYSQMDYFKHQISSENDVGYKVVFLNDVVFSPQNLWMGNINFNESFEIGMVSPSYKVYSVNDGFVPSYLSPFLKTNRMKYEYSICSEQGASIVRRNLNEDEFLQITIPMPDFKTQVTVAKKLKLIEQNVETEKQYLELLIKEKSFLLSSLFI